ncbi:hypothetical protein CCR94_23125 [Rhodoblastus sphagnicola]|uniref:Uncharacterized protein n=1 Tax=Rhodoblastus sphagnicola TaxID=333368 RepID=A0A2S6MUT5_9HYPH|nr:PLP-dependent aminotransferase family protein [Rhodoblastus sphagnicola]MBB4197112.1 DNA-binding transcriptional MocR family regulator [Rhodoblastus sphagnicola]PPQ26112.1 hypothetical protein CCR94_23125 [Rhodoblastus sphagnicola]
MSARSPTFRYRILVKKLTQLIDDGLLVPGDRLPSVRQCARQEKISMTTVLQAYGLLESQGLIQARPQSGYFVRELPIALPDEPSVSTPSRNATRVDVGDRIALILRDSQNPAIVPLGNASPGTGLLPLRALDRLLTARIRRSRHDGAPDYSYPPGEYDLRRQIARRSLDWSGRLDPDDIIITSGCTQAIDLCLRATTRHGDLVAVESPCYFGTLLLLETLGLSAVEIPAHPRDGICLDRLADALATHPIRACVVSPCFSNPLGSLMSDAAKGALLSMLAQRDIPLIEDDTFGELGYADIRPKPAKAFDDSGLVMLCASFSKVLAPGYRIGWTAPGRFRDRVERLQLASTLAVPRIFQHTIADFLANGAYDRHLRRIRTAASVQSRRMANAIGAYFPSGAKVTKPNGGLVLWVELPEGSDAILLSERAMTEDIGICPGPIFSATGQYRNYIRLNAGSPWSPALERAIRRLAELIHEQKSPPRRSNRDGD